MVVIEWIWQNIWTLLLVAFIVRYHKIIYKELIFNPLAGGNGKVQMDETAKAVLIGAFIYGTYKEAVREVEHHIFTNEYFFALLMSICAIAGIKHHYKSLTKKDDGTENKP